MKENRTIQYALVLTRSERAVLRRLAETEGVSGATYLRGLLRLEALKRGLWPTKVEAPPCSP